jgi:threonine/homoserine/homoserine lactone efflux protein
MVRLTLLVGSIAAADSINPSTVVPAIWLATASRGRGLASFTLGAFVVYLAGGLVLVFGPGPALIAALHHIKGPFEHALQAAGGAVALAFAVTLWRSRNREPEERRVRRSHTRASAFALGAGIMAVELPTAFMYFGAITEILAARVHPAVEVMLLLVYNALFVAPLIAILAIKRLAATRADRWLASGEALLRTVGRVALTSVAGVGGATLLAIGVGGLVAA